MAVTQSLVYDIKKLRQILNPPDETIAIVFSFGSTSDPHGPYGGNSLTFTWSKGKESKTLKALSTAEELQGLKRFYDDMIKHNPFMKGESHPWHTYDLWLETQRCKCVRHGLDGLQPFNGNGDCSYGES